MKKITCALSVFVSMLLPLLTFGHPGHGEEGGYTIIHYFKEPTHVLVAAIILILVVATFAYFMKKRSTVKI